MPCRQFATGSILASVLIYATAITELAIPLQLAVLRLRRIGVIVAMSFHTLVSFDLDQHFYDFTAVLLPLFALFLATDALAELGRRRLDRRVALLATAAVLALIVGGAASRHPAYPSGRADRCLACVPSCCP